VDANTEFMNLVDRAKSNSGSGAGQRERFINLDDDVRVGAVQNVNK
jgi:hypothetical protein